MKKFLIIIVLLAIVGVAGFLFLSRPPSAPTKDVNDVTPGLSATSTERLYRISKSGSVAEFRINEILRDSPYMAVGTTSEIAGDISISGNIVTIGTLSINAKTFKTDSSKRDGAIARFILRTEDPANEIITFKPNSIAITAAPAKINAGDTLSLAASGDLTISGVTKPATFRMIMKVADDKLDIMASTTLKRSDFNLPIPNVSFVASVEDQLVAGATIVAPRVTQ